MKNRMRRKKAMPETDQHDQRMESREENCGRLRITLNAYHLFY